MSNNTPVDHLKNSSRIENSIHEIQKYYNKYLIEGGMPFLESFFVWLYLKHNIDLLKVNINYSIVEGESAHGNLASLLDTLVDLYSENTTQEDISLKLLIGAEVLELSLLALREFNENSLGLIYPIISKLMFLPEDQREVRFLGASRAQKGVDNTYRLNSNNHDASQLATA